MAWFRNRSRSPASQPPTLRGNEGIAIVVIEGTDTGRSVVDLASGVAYSPVLDVAGHLQKNAPIGGVLISATTHAELGDEVGGLEPGTPLARENMPTWVLTPDVDA